MRTILRMVFAQTIALFFTTQLLSGLVIRGGVQTYIIGGVVLSALSLTLKPLLKLIAFPLNILTFGLFTWVIHGVVLWVLTLLVKDISVFPFSIPSIAFFGLVVPKIHIYSIIPAYIVIAALVTAIGWSITWLTKT